MIPTLQTIHGKKLTGMSREMTFANDTTTVLWKEFMPRRREIQNAVSSELISMQLYEPDFDFTHFNLHKPYRKWAAVEISDFSDVPSGMETFEIPAGLYAVFLHRGGPVRAAESFGYIFTKWLPESDFLPDNRPHFEILGEKYKHNDPESEEEIWIPVKKRTN